MYQQGPSVHDSNQLVRQPKEVKTSQFRLPASFRRIVEMVDTVSIFW